MAGLRPGRFPGKQRAALRALQWRLPVLPRGTADCLEPMDRLEAGALYTLPV